MKTETNKRQRTDSKRTTIVPERYSELVARLLSVLTPELLKKEYAGSAHPVAGHCFHASEAIYEIVRAQEAGWAPRQVRVDEVSHWFLKNQRTGEILDATSAQFEGPVPYDSARSRGFVTNRRPWSPSKRGREVLRRLVPLLASLRLRPGRWSSSS